MGFELSTPLVFSFSFIYRDEYKGISVMFFEFITSMSILKGPADIS